MAVTVLIPTRGDRDEGIEKCIASVDLEVYFIRVLKNTTGWLPAVNEALKDIEGCMLMGADDMVFHPGAIKKTVDAMRDKYPDEDGVIGFNQVTLKNFCKAGFTLIGSKFMDRFTDRQVFCPDYKHYFADTELLKYAESVGKFTYCPEARVDHYHPSVTGRMDETGKISRMSWIHDRDVAGRREEAKLLWGRDFARVYDTV